MSSVVRGGTAVTVQDDARCAARWALSAQLLRRAAVALLMVVPTAMYAAALAEGSRAVGWVLLIITALAVWFAADAAQVRSGWHVLPGRQLPRAGDLVLLAVVDVTGAALLIVGLEVVSPAVGRVPALSAVPGAFLLFELSWFCVAAAVAPMLTRGRGANPRRARPQEDPTRRTRARAWALAPVHLAIAATTVVVAQARAVPDVRADDVAFSLLATAALLALPPLLRRGLTALRHPATTRRP